MSDLRGKSAINVEKLTMWKYNEETGEYDNAIDFTGRTMSFKDSIKSNTAKLYGDGQVVDSVTVTTEGTLEINISADLEKEDRKAVLGELFKNGANITKVDAIVPIVAVALQTRTSTGKVKLRKWLRVQFAEPDEEIQQKETGATFSTIKLTGTYMSDENGVLRSRIDDLDETEDKTKIQNWFTDAKCIDTATQTI